MDLKNLLNVFFSALNRHIDTGFGKLSNDVTKVGKDIRDTDSRNEIQKLGNRMERMVEKMSSPEFKVEVDFGVVQKELKDIGEQLKKFKVPELKKIEATLFLIANALKDNSQKNNTEELKELTKVMKALKTYETIKIDDAQIKALMASQQSIMTNGGILSARKVTVENTTLTSADTEYTYTFPKNTVAWELRIRSNNVPLLISYTTGTLPTSGDGSAYFTVPAYYIQQNTGMDWGGKTLYVQTGSATQVLEVISYQA